FGAFQDLVYVNSRASIEIGIVCPVGHEPAGFDKLLLGVNSRQPVFCGKFDNLRSSGKKIPRGGSHDCIDLLLLCGFEGALKTPGVGCSLDLLQLELQCRSRTPELFHLEVLSYATS